MPKMVNLPIQQCQTTSKMMFCSVVQRKNRILLFYLRSRKIEKNKAQSYSVLAENFASKIIVCLRRENYEAEKWDAKCSRDFMTTNVNSVQPMLLGDVRR